MCGSSSSLELAFLSDTGSELRVLVNVWLPKFTGTNKKKYSDAAIMTGQCCDAAEYFYDTIRNCVLQSHNPTILQSYDLIRIVEGRFNDDLQCGVFREEVSDDVGPVVAAHRHVRKKVGLPVAAAVDHSCLR